MNRIKNEKRRTILSIKDWSREDRRNVIKRIGEKIRPSPIRERLSRSIYRLRVIHNRLEQSAYRMEQRDKSLFEKCVRAQESKDPAKAAMYANECAQIRNIVQVTLRSQITLEAVLNRLETVQTFGDLAHSIGPVASVVATLKNQLSGVIPEMAYKFEEVGNALNEMVLEVGEATGVTEVRTSPNEEAQKILNEAYTVAEQKMREKFPELPTTATAEREKPP